MISKVHRPTIRGPGTTTKIYILGASMRGRRINLGIYKNRCFFEHGRVFFLLFLV